MNPISQLLGLVQFRPGRYCSRYLYVVPRERERSECVFSSRALGLSAGLAAAAALARLLMAQVV